MTETLSALKFSKLKPSQFNEIIAWDNGQDSFFRFINPLKITKENLLGLLKNEHNLIFTVKNEGAESAQALIQFTHFHPVHKTVQASWTTSPTQTLSEKETLSMLYEFCQICFKKYQIHKIQFSFLEKSKEVLLGKVGAVKEGFYQKHFYSQGQFHDVQSFRLFKEELKAA